MFVMFWFIVDLFFWVGGTSSSFLCLLYCFKTLFVLHRRKTSHAFLLWFLCRWFWWLCCSFVFFDIIPSVFCLLKFATTHTYILVLYFASFIHFVVSLAFVFAPCIPLHCFLVFYRDISNIIFHVFLYFMRVLYVRVLFLFCVFRFLLKMYFEHIIFQYAYILLLFWRATF